ncbi:tRNA (adenosine(37)-N6)-dimethylallyltransferase MiaA [Lacticaseibacillus parakribbianus]|uniref:tRNA (adenosine(37)-N6)-dimethylallyltransferase MiaA n=1 Tax=Lacticaseibacillus parakribbianus TaxID=2970927 RepID=UPI0021CB1550|nr:tRNA (adenosine(37)-N6)-dimethylallyltransferase MiaA [Lacticaseibacillus parakribbianus]
MNSEAFKTQILMIGGPTATGKSALAVALAKRFSGEVINGDAYQIYTGMDIGTAKVTPAEMAGVPHHLVDIVAPGTPFSAAQFAARATAAIEAVSGRGHLPIVVGGTGFYLNTLRLGLNLGGAAPPAGLRAALNAELAAAGPAALHKRLEAVDPAAAAAIPEGNPRRVIRALEVAATGQLFSRQQQSPPAYDALVLGLTTERSALYARINARVDQMLTAGLLAEVRRVVAAAGPEAQALRAIGYKEFLPYLNGDCDLAAAVAAVKQNSRRYAKRQLTYFRHQMPTHWFDLVAHPEELKDVEALVASWQTKENKH